MMFACNSMSDIMQIARFDISGLKQALDECIKMAGEMLMESRAKVKRLETLPPHWLQSFFLNMSCHHQPHSLPTTYWPVSNAAGEMG